MANVYSKTLTAATDDDSGTLDVSSYGELWLAVNVSEIDWAGSAWITLSRLDAFNDPTPVTTVQLMEGKISAEIGPGRSVDVELGDNIQLATATTEGTSVSCTISLIGK